MFWRPGDQYKHEMWVKTVLSCCLKSLWWYYWICFASKLYGKQIYQHITERVLEGWMLRWTLLKCTVTREYKVRGCGCYSGSGSPAFCKGRQKGSQNTRAGRKLIKIPPLPFSADVAVHQMKKYQLSHEALEPCRRNVRTVSVDIQSHGLGHYSGSRVTSTNRWGGVPLEKTNIR